MQSDNYEQITLYIRDYFSAMWLLKMEVSLDLVKYVANLGLYYRICSAESSTIFLLRRRSREQFM